MLKIAIVGKKADTGNYIKYVRSINAAPLSTQSLGALALCDALILPGGGDITPAFFGEQNCDSHNIDTALDIIQLQALDLALRRGLPVLGICKGLQIINVGLGGTLVQDMPTAAIHKYDRQNGCDRHHTTIIEKASWLYPLYGSHTTVNSAHHQAIKKLGSKLIAVQHCPEDDCIEGIAHRSLPVLGVQWHPERIDDGLSGTNGRKLLSYFSSLIPAGKTD